MDVRTIFNGLLGMTIVVLGGCSDPAPPSSGVSPFFQMFPLLQVLITSLLVALL